ncbi:hypothetical protein Tco_0512446 [Tanacetum coccineum]
MVQTLKLIWDEETQGLEPTFTGNKEKEEAESRKGNTVVKLSAVNMLLWILLGGIIALHLYFAIEVDMISYSANNSNVCKRLKESAGVLHLKKLSDAGLIDIHLLPTFQLGDVQDEKDKWKFVGEPAECCSTHLIDGDGTFNATGLDAFIKEVKLSECGLSYDVFSIMGPQKVAVSGIAEGTEEHAAKSSVFFVITHKRKWTNKCLQLARWASSTPPVLLPSMLLYHGSSTRLWVKISSTVSNQPWLIPRHDDSSIKDDSSELPTASSDNYWLVIMVYQKFRGFMLERLCDHDPITCFGIKNGDQIEPTVALFRVFQTLCKQGDWFSFAKRRDPSPVCIDDNRSCMKHWKSGFFFIDRRAIMDSMVWRHPGVTIDDLRPVAGSHSMAYMRRLSSHVIKLRDMPKAFMGIHDFFCLLKWTDVEVQEEPHLDDPALEDLAVGTPSSKILAKAEASQNLFVGDSDNESDCDDDACVEIPLVTPLRSAVVIPLSGNQGGSSAASASEGSNSRDSRGKGIMADDADAPSVGVSRPRPSSGPAPSFRDEVFKDPTICKTVVDQFPTPGEMVWVESLSDDQLIAKMSVLHCMMMSHGGELLSLYRGLNQSHHEYVLSSDSRLKDYEEKSKAKGNEREKKIKSLTKSLDNLHTEVACLSAALNQVTVLEAEKDEEILRLRATPPEFSSFFQSQFQGLVRKFLASHEFSRVQGELLSLAASVGFERGLSRHRTKDEFVVVLKKMANFMPGAQDRLHATKPLLVILYLEPEKLACPTNVPLSRDARVSPPTTKESTMTPVSKSLELSTNADLTPSAVASEHNEEMVNVEVDVSDPKMTNETIIAKSRHAFVQGISVALRMLWVGGGRVRVCFLRP